MSDMRPILIAGPTASGKSGLALRLAEQLGGVVINADSMQVYRELRILTARPGPEEEARVPHALYGFVPGSESYSAGRYAADVARVLEDRAARRPPSDHRRRHRPLLQDADRGAVAHSGDPRRRARPLAHVAAEKGAAHLHGELAMRDAEMAAAARQRRHAARRARARGARRTGMSLAEWQRRPRQPVLDLAAAIPLARRGRARRAGAPHRCALWADGGEGGLEEVLQLKALGLDPSLPLMTALGVRPLLATWPASCRSKRRSPRPNGDAAVRETAGDVGAK